MIEKGMENAVEFSSVFSLFLDGRWGGEHVEVMKRAYQLAQTASDVLLRCLSWRRIRPKPGEN